MTHFTTTRDPEIARELRTPVRLPDQMNHSLFQGWGPKF